MATSLSTHFLTIFSHKAWNLPPKESCLQIRCTSVRFWVSFYLSPNLLAQTSVKTPSITADMRLNSASALQRLGGGRYSQVPVEDERMCFLLKFIVRIYKCKLYLKSLKSLQQWIHIPNHLGTTQSQTWSTWLKTDTTRNSKDAQKVESGKQEDELKTCVVMTINVNRLNFTPRTKSLT